MKNKKQSACKGFSEHFYGSSTVGERGQIVIPAEARAEMGIQAGDKVLIMRHPVFDGLMIFQIDAVNEVIEEFTRRINQLAEETENPEEEMSE